MEGWKPCLGQAPLWSSSGLSVCRENAENMYFFSSLALTLNEPEERVAPTDSRLCPDQRLMESGRWDEANVEKQRLEEKQRAVRRRREAEAVEALEEGGMMWGGEWGAAGKPCRAGEGGRTPRRGIIESENHGMIEVGIGFQGEVQPPTHPHHAHS